MIDGVYNSSRKLYILTTNNLTIDECNIMGEVPSDKELDIPKAKFKLRIIEFGSLDRSSHQGIMGLIKEQLAINETVEEWLNKTAIDKNENTEKKLNRDMLEDK